MAMHLANAISYITDEEKTQCGLLVGSHNCNADTALQEMLSAKRKYGKADKRQGYHFIISFKKQEVRPETAMEITQKFVERYFGDDFQCLYATHDNTQHVHSHILFNSVSWRTGRKYRYEKGDWAREIQPIVNELCKEYGLSIQDIEIGTKEKEPKKWDKTKQGIFRWNRQIGLDVEDSISFATGYVNFLKLMELKGYGVKSKDGETYLKPIGEKRFIRLTDISGHYTEEEIETRLDQGIRRETVQKESHAPRIIGYRKNYREYTPLSPYQKAFLAKMYRTGQLKKKPFSQMWRYKAEAAEFEKLQSEYLYLCRHKIRSAEELEDRKKDLATRMDGLDDARHQIYKRRYPHKNILALLKTIEENKTRASYYKEGSLFYAPYYEKWREAAEAVVRKGYTLGQVLDMKEMFQRELAAVAEAKRGLKREENLICGILSGKSRVRAVEITVPEAGAPHKALENLREADTAGNHRNDCLQNKNVPAGKGGDAEKTGWSRTEIPAHTEAGYLEKQPAQAK